MTEEIHTDESHSMIINKVWNILEQVPDPEVPVLSILDLGIVRNVEVVPSMHSSETSIKVLLTPTYTGCPAMDMISIHIRLALLEHGYKSVKIESTLSPAWTTAWMSDAGKQKLKAYGIAPPLYSGEAGDRDGQLFPDPPAVECPLCNSPHTALISQFGCTACKALYQCQDCKEPFDYFKCH